MLPFVSYIDQSSAQTVVTTGGGGTVSFDASGFTANSGTSPSTSTPITVGSGSNRALLVYVGQRSGSLGSSGTSVTWNGTSMVQIGTVDAANGTLWGLVNPASGLNNLVVTFTGGGTVSIGVLSVTGANQTGSTTTFHDYTTISGTTTVASSVTVPSANNEIVFAGYITATPTLTTTGIGTTDIGSTNAGVNGEACNWGSSTGITKVMSYNFANPTDFNVASGVSIKGA